VAVFLEALRPIEVRGARFQVGVTAGYLHGDQTATGFPPPLVSAQIDLDQVPILAVARWRAALPLRFDVAADVMAGFSWAETHIDTIAGTAAAWALGAGAEISLPLKPGRLVIGLRYLRIDLGRTSQGDVFLGNCVGLVGDLGYKMTF
jgi:hypothetical protein